MTYRTVVYRVCDLQDSKSVDELSRLMELSLGETVSVTYIKERKNISYK